MYNVLLKKERTIYIEGIPAQTHTIKRLNISPFAPFIVFTL